MTSKYTKIQENFIKKHYKQDMNRHEFMLIFNKHFNANRSSAALYDKAVRLGAIKIIEHERGVKYTKAQENYIKEKYNNPLSGKEFTKAFNKKFKLHKTNNGVTEKARELGVTIPVKFTDKQLEFLKENSSKYSRIELTKKFNKKFNQNRTECSIETACRRRGYKLYIIHNPGDVWLDREYLRIKLSKEENKIWKRKSEVVSFGQYIYWQEKGIIPKKNDFMVYLDGDVQNCDIDNLYLIDAKTFGKLGGHKWLDIDHPVLKKVAIEHCKFEKIIEEAK